MSPPRAETESEPRTMPERLTRVETLIDERKEGARSQGERLEKLAERMATLEKFMAEEEAREEMARQAKADAHWATLLSKISVGTGVGGTLYAIWQMLHGG